MKFTLAAAALAVACIATQAAASTVDITGITGKWTAAAGTSVSGLNSDSIRWGQPTGSGKSGYDFDSAPTPISDVAENVLFSLGDFVHVNRPITGGSITSATLQVAINIMIGSVSQTINSVYQFSHWETDNNPGYHSKCANGDANGIGVNKNGCADRVTATLNLGSSDSFFIGDDEYVFVIEGFKVGGDLFSEFWTKENAENAATLKGRYVLKECVSGTPTSDKCKPIDPDDPSEVPLPAAGWLMVAGLGGLGAMARRRKS